MNYKDNRGRVRVTVDGVRVEINRDGAVRFYRRYTPHDNAERREHVINGPVEALNLRVALAEACRRAGW